MKTVVSIFLTLIVAITTTGVVVNQHHCGDRVADTKLFIEADKCFDGEVDMPMGCCHDEEMVAQLELDYEVNKIEAPTNNNLVVAFVYTLFQSNLNRINTKQYLAYKPPLPDKDIPVLIQSFLI